VWRCFECEEDRETLLYIFYTTYPPSSRLLYKPNHSINTNKQLSYMHGAQYTEVQHERHLNSLCAYPLCDKTPAAPYRSQKRFLVSTARRTITEKEGNDEEAFCSRKCAARSAWVASSLGTEAAWIRGKVEPIELLEDKEAKGEVSWGGRRGDVLVWNKKGGEVAATSAPVQPPQATPAKSTPMFTATIAPRDPPSSISKLPTPHAAPAPAPIPAPTQTLSTPDQMSDLIASLSIVERETPGSRPAPPGAPAYVEQGRVVGGSVASLPLPLPSGGVLANSAVNIGGIGGIGPASVSVSTPKADRRAASSLLNMGGLKSTATTVLAAAEKLQPQGDSSDESESEEEWAKEMGWGRGDEVDAVFAEAARAREMMAEK
jgi:hypothetical protein